MSAVEPGPEPAASGRREIALQNPNRYPEVDLEGLERWLGRVVDAVAPEALRLVGDRAMRRLNRDFRGRDATTDVLSFPGETGPEGRRLGDVAISMPAARRQAESAGHPLDRELKILALHGLLHCLGHDHERDDGEMERLERRLRRRFVDDDG